MTAFNLAQFLCGQILQSFLIQNKLGWLRLHVWAPFLGILKET